MNTYYVVFKNGQIGHNSKIIAEYNTKTEALEKAKRMNKLLSEGEKKYYKMKYCVETD